MKYSTLGLAVMTALSLSACIPVNEENTDEARICDPGLGQVSTSDGRTLCIELNTTKADAPFMPGFKAPGRVQHTITITDGNSGVAIDTSSDATIKGVMQYPMMEMLSGHSHSTPTKMMADTTDSANGNYELVSYYLMPSAMNGNLMGHWEYRVMLKDIGADGVADTADDSMLKATFHPTVDMVMGGNKFGEKTERRTAGVYEDKMAGMEAGSSTYRMYGIWLESISNNGDGSHALELFINAKDMLDMMGSMDHGEMDMAHYPGLVAGMSLKDENGAAVSVDAVTVEVTTVASPLETDWIALSATIMDGYYAGDVAGLATDAQNTLQVRVTVTTTVGGVTSTETMSVRGTDDTMPTLVFTAPQ